MNIETERDGIEHEFDKLAEVTAAIQQATTRVLHAACLSWACGAVDVLGDAELTAIVSRGGESIKVWRQHITRLKESDGAHGDDWENQQWALDVLSACEAFLSSSKRDGLVRTFSDLSAETTPSRETVLAGLVAA